MAQVKLLKIASGRPAEHDSTADDLAVLSLLSDTVLERTAEAGVNIDSVLLKDGGINMAASQSLSVAGTAILSDSSGTMTLSNVDALDATTEATIEAAIDTLANLTSATALASVGTITTGVWSATDIAVDAGGTGRSSATAYAVLCGGTTSTAAHQSVASVGNSGDVLTSNGAGALPTFQAASINYKATYTNGNAGTIALGDVVYMTSTNDKVDLANATTISQGDTIVGIVAQASILTNNAGDIHVVRGGVITGILSAATAGTVYYLSTAGTTTNTMTTTPPSGGPALVKLGFAKNATDFVFCPEFIADTTA